MAKRSIQKPILILLVIGFITFVLIFKPIRWSNALSIEKINAVTTITVEKDKRGNIVKTTESTTNRTLWDWLSLLGVPLTLAILGYWLQQLQQKRAEEFAKEQQERAKEAANVQREIAANENKEEVLQAYFDRLSVLLIDKNLIAIATKITLNESKATDEEKELLDSSKNIIRARTLSILRRFEDDAQRKASVIQFLIESEIVNKLELNMYQFNLSKTNLSWSKLPNANLPCADFTEAELYWANLTEATLRQAKFIKATLFRAMLFNTNLQGADFSEANLTGADLSKANLSGANFTLANLSGANLKGVNLALTDFEKITWSSKTKWPDKSELAKAKNIPDELRKELGLDEETKA